MTRSFTFRSLYQELADQYMDYTNQAATIAKMGFMPLEGVPHQVQLHHLQLVILLTASLVELLLLSLSFPEFLLRLQSVDGHT